MALPRQLPTAWNSSTDYSAGPFVSSGGSAYIVGRSGTVVLDVIKSANPSTTAFTYQDAADNPTTSSTPAIRGTTAVRDVDAVQVGDVLHIACLSYTTPAMGDWTWYWDYFTFNMATDQWAAPTDATVWSTTADPDVTTGQIRIMVRGFDSDIVIVGKGPDASDMGSPYDTLYHGYWNGTAWSTPTLVDEGVAGNHYRYPTLSNDYTTDGDYTVTWMDDTSFCDGRAITGASHTQQSVGEVGSLSTRPVPADPYWANIVYNDSGTWRGSCVIASSGGQADGKRYDPTSNTPFASETTETDITGADTPAGGLLCYDPATDTRYLVYRVSGTPDAIKYVSSVSEATWGSITSHSTPANDTQLVHGKAQVYTSPVDGSTVIGFMYFDNTSGAVYYDEIALVGDQTISANPATGSWESVAPTVSLGALNKTANPATGKWAGVSATPVSTQSVTANSAVGSWEGVAPTPAFGVLAKSVLPSVGSWQGVSATPQFGALAEPVLPSAGIWQGVAPTVDIGAFAQPITPAVGTWEGVLLTAAFGALNKAVNPSQGTWQGVTVTPVPGAVNVAITPVVGTWQGVPITAYQFIAVVANPATGTWEGVTITPAFGAISEAVLPSQGTWQGVAATIAATLAKAVSPSVGTWQGVAPSAAFGAISEPVIPAQGVWQGVTATPVPGVFAITANPSTGTWQGVAPTPSFGAVNVTVDPATGTWQGVVLGIDLSAIIGVGASIGSWQGVSATPSLATLLITADPATGTWQGVTVTSVVGALNKAVLASVGTWEAVAPTLSFGPINQSVGIVQGAWIGVTATPAFGALSIPANPAVGTWQGVVLTVDTSKNILVGVADGSWTGVVITPTVGVVLIAADPAAGAWQGVTIAPAFGAINQAVAAAVGTWLGVAPTPSFGAIQQALTAAVGTWQGVTPTVSATLSKAVSPAVGTWQGVLLGVDEGGQFIAADPATGEWQAVLTTVDLAALNIPVTPAAGTWEGVVLGVLSGITVGVTPSVGSWEGVITAPSLGITQITVDPATGAWLSVPVVSQVGAVNVPVGSVVGTWEAVTATVATVNVIVANPALGAWQGVVSTPVVGDVNIPVLPSVGTWEAVAITIIGIEEIVTKYIPEHLKALRKARTKGAIASFTHKVPGVYDPYTDATVGGAETTVDGYAVELPDVMEQRDLLELLPQAPVTLFFVPTTIGEEPRLGDRILWGNQQHTVDAVTLYHPDGVTIAAYVALSEAAAVIGTNIVDDSSVDHSKALRKVRIKGKAVTFSLELEGTYDALTDAFSSPSIVTVEGHAVAIPGDPEKYDELELVSTEAVTLIFVPNTFGEQPKLGSTLEWNGEEKTIADTTPIRPTGQLVAAQVVLK